VARNRKRAKERRDRRPQPVSRPRLAPARANGGDGNPSPIEHATPDVELAEAQLEVGRPDLVDDGDGENGAGGGVGVEDAATLNADQVAAVGESREGPQPSTPAAGAVALPAEHKQGLWSRIVGFLQGSWRELQRVQWPDRRQVVQATAVVIGFVIVAGVFLGVADTAASHLMDYILTGH
jgi:preprotein translocase SecE subunit